MRVSPLSLLRLQNSSLASQFSLLALLSVLAFLSFSSAFAAQDNAVRIYTTRDGLAGDYVTSIAFASDGSAWVGTTEGATHIEPNRWTSYTRAHGLGDSWITAIAIAPDQRVWFGTQSGGLSVFDPISKTITTYNLDNSDLPSNFITALDVDQNNRVWIDTLNKGVAYSDPPTQKWRATSAPMPPPPPPAQAGRATPRGLVVTNPPAWLQPPTPYPVVLIHGWTVAGDDTLETSEFKYLKSYADRDGIPMYYVRGVSPKNTLYQNAQVIRDEIARVKKETGAQKVNIIGFSMGGMNTRAYLETSLYANDVHRAILLGTPQAGVEIWKPILFQQILQKPDEPSAIELSPEYAQVVNATRSPNPNVPYDLLIGDAVQQPHLDFLQDMPASDALISVNSALALGGANVRKHVNADLHDWSPQAVPLEFTAYLYPRDTWERYLRNALRNDDNAPIGSEIATAPSAPLLQGEEGEGAALSMLPSPTGRGGTGEVSNHTPVVTQKINAGETVTRTVLIDENKSARFISYYPGGKIRFSIVAPDGKKYEPGALPHDNGAGVLSLSTDIANFSGYEVKSAPVGTWQMILQRTDGGGDAIEVSTYVELNAPLTLNAFAHRQTVAVGATNTITASVRINSGEALRAVTMTARIAQPAATPGGAYTFTDVELFDDGKHDDGAANDGFFANAYTPPRGGWYPVFVQAQGENFRREKEFLFAANPGGAQIMDVEVKSPIEPNTHAHVEWVNVNVERAGDYLLSVQAMYPNQAPFARVFPFSLQPGTIALGTDIDSDFYRAGEPRSLEYQLLDARWAAIPIAAPKVIIESNAP
jgi:pimeloyl-ACP methyl ester carboxylesterase